MAKRFTLATATATAVLLLTTAAMAQTEVRFTHSITGGSSREALDLIIADFEAANPDIKIKEIVFDDDQYSNQGLITQLKSNEVPDIFFDWAGLRVQRNVEAGYAYDLTEAMATDGWKESFAPSVWTEGAGTMVDGKPYLVPLSLDLTNTIWYNTKMFAEAGVTPPKTWDEFVEVIKKIAASGVTPIVEGNNEFWPLGNWAGHIAAKVVPPDEYIAAFKQEGPFNTPGFENFLSPAQGASQQIFLRPRWLAPLTSSTTELLRFPVRVTTSTVHVADVHHKRISAGVFLRKPKCSFDAPPLTGDVHNGRCQVT